MFHRQEQSMGLGSKCPFLAVWNAQKWASNTLPCVYMPIWKMASEPVQIAI
jgi:hypothetical protein